MTAALIVASGKTARGKRYDPLAQVGGLTPLQRLVLSFKQAGVGHIAVVNSAPNTPVEKGLAQMNVVFLHNPDEDAQMLDNIKLGIRFLQSQASRIFVTTAKAPVFLVETVEELLATNAELAVPVHNGKTGHPLLISSGLFADILAYEGSGGLEGFLQRHSAGLLELSVQDEGVNLHISGKAGAKRVEQATHRHSLRKLRYDLKLTLAREDTCFGPGIYLLMQLIEELGNIRDACRYMGLSYSKGWRKVVSCEKMLGFKLVARQQGGDGGGTSRLTAEGRELMRRYNQFNQAAQREIDRLFCETFDGLYDDVDD